MKSQGRESSRKYPRGQNNTSISDKCDTDELRHNTIRGAEVGCKRVCFVICWTLHRKDQLGCQLMGPLSSLLNMNYVKLNSIMSFKVCGLKLTSWPAWSNTMLHFPSQKSQSTALYLTSQPSETLWWFSLWETKLLDKDSVGCLLVYLKLKRLWTPSLPNLLINHIWTTTFAN